MATPGPMVLETVTLLRYVPFAADGLAAGKGVVVASDANEAVAAVRHLMRDKAFGEAGASVVTDVDVASEPVLAAASPEVQAAPRSLDGSIIGMK